MAKATAKLNYLHIAPRKVRLVASVIRGMNVQEAEAELMFRTNRASGPLRKLLRSAVANAKQAEMNTAKLVVSDIRVDQGPMMKRWMPRAMGRATPIQKKMSHVTIVLEESEDVNLPAYTVPDPKEEDEKKSSKKGTKKESEKQQQVDDDDQEELDKNKQRDEAMKTKGNESLKAKTKNIFRRKSV